MVSAREKMCEKLFFSRSKSPDERFWVEQCSHNIEIIWSSFLWCEHESLISQRLVHNWPQQKMVDFSNPLSHRSTTIKFEVGALLKVWLVFMNFFKWDTLSNYPSPYQPSMLFQDFFCYTFFEPPCFFKIFFVTHFLNQCNSIFDLQRTRKTIHLPTCLLL